MSTEPITVQALAIELGSAWAEIASRASALCREVGTTNVLAAAAGSSAAEWLLCGSAADLIRDDLATANT